MNAYCDDGLLDLDSLSWNVSGKSTKINYIDFQLNILESVTHSIDLLDL